MVSQSNWRRLLKPLLLIINESLSRLKITTPEALTNLISSVFLISQSPDKGDRSKEAAVATAVQNFFFLTNPELIKL